MKSLRPLTLGFFACFLLGPSLHAQCLAPDDIGDTAGTCATLPSSSYNQIHSIAASDRSDVDLFSFVAIPGATYNITVEEVSISALDVCLRASDGAYILDRKNTAGTGIANLTFVWNNSTIGGLFYVDVRSLGEATEGTYRLRMTTTQPLDKDGDLLPDEWETRASWANGPLSDNGFTGANAPNGTEHDFDGDGFTNFEELLMGSDPTDPTSGLIIAEIAKDIVKSDLTYPVFQFGTYELSWFDTRDSGSAWGDDANWTPVDQFTHMGANGMITTPDVDGAPPEFKIYRLRQFGIPHPDCVLP